MSGRGIWTDGLEWSTFFLVFFGPFLLVIVGVKIYEWFIK